MKFKKFNFKKVISTNNTAINIIKRHNLNYGMIISDNQKNGRGQYGRKWISFKGNLFISFFYNLDKINLSIKKITKINCDLVKKNISKFNKKKITFKAPNDLLIDKKKICGILQEKITKNDKNFLIVGIGINLVKSPKISNYPTTNLYEITGKKLSYKLLADSLKSLFEKKFSKFFKR
tara:strand:+ start:427 stop:960 length:534 start_codon:yes stop_codon:yes gene_type:complete